MHTKNKNKMIKQVVLIEHDCATFLIKKIVNGH